MNSEMSYLLGMILGNGQVQRGHLNTTISIDIPHKKLATEAEQDVLVYVRASIADIRAILEPLMGTNLNFIQNPTTTILSFTKPSNDYLIREVLRYINRASSHEYMRVSEDVFDFNREHKIQFLRGLCDVTGYVRRSNYYFETYKHRVYIEVPRNWGLVVDICNLLKELDVPVQTIDWAHPNIRDANLRKYNEGNHNFWKKEHQIKIYANEFNLIGFGVIHKRNALEAFSRELVEGFQRSGIIPSTVTHKFYWECREVNREKPAHPGEFDEFIPEEIRGKHYDSWRKIAEDLGYVR